MPAKLAIITACFNSESTILACIASRQRRLGAGVQHIVQDGASTDDTVRLIDELSDTSIDLLSEPDRGIYDALNKAVSRADADWLMFLHSDDCLVNDNVLNDIEAAERAGINAISYGVVFCDAGGRRTRRWDVGPYNIRSFRYGFMLPHTGLVVKRELFDRYGGFRLDLGSAADYEWILRVFYKGGERPLIRSDEPLIEMRAGGASDAGFRARIFANRNDRKSWKVNGLTPSLFFRLLKPLRKTVQFSVFRR